MHFSKAANDTVICGFFLPGNRETLASVHTLLKFFRSKIHVPADESGGVCSYFTYRLLYEQETVLRNFFISCKPEKRLCCAISAQPGNVFRQAVSKLCFPAPKPYQLHPKTRLPRHVRKSLKTR